MERLLRQVPRTGHAARQGAQNAGAKEVEGHLRDHAGQGALSRLVETQHSEQTGVRRSKGLASAFRDSISRTAFPGWQNYRNTCAVTPAMRVIEYPLA